MSTNPAFDAKVLDDPRGAACAPRRLIGRDDALATLERMLAAHRLVSIVGPGGVGKTSVALALAHARSGALAVLDLAAMPDARHLLPALAQALGLPDGATGRERDLGQRFAALLAGRRLLVVLDGCEHMIDDAAMACELLLAAVPGVAVLATSREALRADGEQVYRLGPMTLPEPDTADAACALAAPAVRLFALRAFGGRALAQAEVAPVVALCRHLDGLPLALELAAAMAPRLGLDGLVARARHWLLDPVPGRRGRHLSLDTMLDWSYDLLAPAEQAVFRRLSVFRGGFTLEAAAAVVAGPDDDPEDAKERVVTLAAKSLVVPAQAPAMRLRLLATTRAYAARRHQIDPDRDLVRQRHAGYLCRLLDAADGAWTGMPRAAWLACYAPWLDDVRAALDWAFAPGGDDVLGVRLAAAGFPLADQAGAGLEFGTRVGQALAVLARLGEPLPLLRLRLAGFVWDQRSEGGGQVDTVLRAHASALRRGAAGNGAQLESGPLIARWCFRFGGGDYPGALAEARAMAAAAQAQGDPVLALLGRKALAQSLHFMGHHGEALAAARAALATTCRIPLGYVASPVPTAVAMRIVMARTLWMQGDPGAAAAMCEDAIASAGEDRPVGLCHVLALAALPVALWNRDLDAARPLLERLERHARRYSFGLWQGWGATYRELLGCLAGGGRDGLALAAFAERVAARDATQSDHLATFGAGLLAPAAYARVDGGAVGWCAPEALRVRAGMLMARPMRLATGADGPETLLRRALELARRQGAVAWERRAAGSLAGMA